MIEKSDKRISPKLKRAALVTEHVTPTSTLVDVTIRAGAHQRTRARDHADVGRLRACVEGGGVVGFGSVRSFWEKGSKVINRRFPDLFADQAGEAAADVGRKRAANNCRSEVPDETGRRGRDQICRTRLPLEKDGG